MRTPQPGIRRLAQLARLARLARRTLGLAIVVGSVFGGCGRIDFDLIGAADAGAEPDRGALSILRVGEAAGSDLRSVTSDTSLIDDVFDDNCGRCDNIYAGVGEVGLLRFDLSSLDAAFADSASIELWLENDPTSEGSVQFHVMLEAWDEGDRSSQGAGVANWIERQPGVPWTAEGAGEGSRESQPFLELVPSPVGVMTEVPLPIDTVQRWLDDPSSNHGILVVGRTYGGDGGQGHPHFHSSESIAEDRRPTLVLGVR